MTLRPRRGIAILAVVLGISACASNPPPPPTGTAAKYPNYPTPDVPAALSAPTDIRARHDIAWRRLQAGDLRGANRDFSEILKRLPGFYPSVTGLGFAALADRQYKTAAARFAAALGGNDRYVPAWVGKVEAELGLGNDAEAIMAMERLVALDPRREGVAQRLEMVRFKQLQALIETGRNARVAGRLNDAAAALERALAASPSSTVILRELALVEVKRANPDAAEGYLRRATRLDPADAEGHAALAEVLEAQKKYGEASAAFLQAATIDPRPEWRAKAAALRSVADKAAIPEELRDTAGRATVTRGEVAAYIGVNLATLIERAPRSPAMVATDVRMHWAAQWITAVTRAGVMDLFANHTFQPGAVVRRNDLASIVSALVELAGRPADVTRWRAARPRFVDLPTTNVFYRPAALSVAAGALSADDAGRFQPTRSATGAELTTAIGRISQLAAREF